ncbi:MAG: hypothetical protein LBT41_05185 [Candidatus Methanoplasma sp.]|jgi:predicted transcriptional regulator|nr:hypothetical protein [Candidatus Methanoplasma sp.]
MGVASMLGRTTEELELLQRHIEMLRVTKENQPIGIIRLSEILGVPKHKVRYSLRLLEREGLIAATGGGAVVSEKYDEFMADLPDFLDSVVKKVETIKTEASR